MSPHYCRVVQGMHDRPHDKVDLTVRQFIELKRHVQSCAACRANIDDLFRKYPDRAFGPGYKSDN